MTRTEGEPNTPHMDALSIENCLGMNVDERNAAYPVLADDPSLCSQLIEHIAANAGYQGVASWFLKRHLETGGRLSGEQINQVYGAAEQLEDWESILHILQCIPYLGIPVTSRATAERFVRHSLQHANKFVRAWAYNGFAELADVYEDLQLEVAELLETAARQEAASVKARIRQVSRRFSWAPVLAS